MAVRRRPWQPREDEAARRLFTISRRALVATTVLAVATAGSLTGIIASNHRHSVTQADAATVARSSSSSTTDASTDPGSSSASSNAATVGPSSVARAVIAVPIPKSQGRPGVIPVPLAPRAVAGPIPLLAWQAYHRAAAGSGCKLPWYVLAGIGKIESNHGRFAGNQFEVDGTVTPGIFGPPTAYGRAMGPMQFIPPTWAAYATDGNGDDITNPQNIFDETKAAAHYLCNAGGPDLSGVAAQRRAVFAYNHLDSYVADVMAFATAYQHGQPEHVVHVVPIVYPKSPRASSTSPTAPRATTTTPRGATSTTTSSTTTSSTSGRQSSPPLSGSTSGASPTRGPTSSTTTTATTTAVPSCPPAITPAPTTTPTPTASATTATPTTSGATCPTCPPAPSTSAKAHAVTSASGGPTPTSPTSVVPTARGSAGRSAAPTTSAPVCVSPMSSTTSSASVAGVKSIAVLRTSPSAS